MAPESNVSHKNAGDTKKTANKSKSGKGKNKGNRSS